MVRAMGRRQRDQMGGEKAKADTQSQRNREEEKIQELKKQETWESGLGWW